MSGQAPAEAPCCVYCLEDRLIEFDPVTRRFVCLVCARTWPPVADGAAGETERFPATP